jgi:hypothetical protein
LLKLCFLCWPKFNFCWLVFHVVAITWENEENEFQKLVFLKQIQR